MFVAVLQKQHSGYKVQDLHVCIYERVIITWKKAQNIDKEEDPLQEHVSIEPTKTNQI